MLPETGVLKRRVTATARPPDFLTRPESLAHEPELYHPQKGHLDRGALLAALPFESA